MRRRSRGQIKVPFQGIHQTVSSRGPEEELFPFNASPAKRRPRGIHHRTISTRREKLESEGWNWNEPAADDDDNERQVFAVVSRALIDRRRHGAREGVLPAASSTRSKRKAQKRLGERRRVDRHRAGDVRPLPRKDSSDFRWAACPPRAWQRARGDLG